MKIYAVLTVLLALVMLFFPFISLNNNEMKESTTAVSSSSAKDDTVKVLRVSSGEVVSAELFDYIVGSVAAEMPASYEIEALKAQAVVCYTYQKYLSENEKGANAASDISDDSTTHQGYKSKEELKALWGDKYDSYLEKIEKAVDSVFGEYLTYNGKTALTVFHALSPGVTESAKNVWGNDLPYLQSVSAPGDKLSADYGNKVTFSKAEFEEIVKKEGLAPHGKEKTWCTVTKSTDNGYVQKAELAGKEITGEEVRTIFSLDSAFFTVDFDGTSFIFTVSGKGHGVGMSQYSADYMARQGSSYREILSHFYKGTEIRNN